MNAQDLFFKILAETMLKEFRPVLAETKAEIINEVQRLLEIKAKTDEAYSVPEIMQIKNVKSRTTVYSLIKKYGIKNVGIGRTARFKMEDIEEAISKQKSGE